MKNNDIKFETLKKPVRKKIIIGSIIAVAIVSAITLTTSRAKFRLTQSIPVVRGFIKYDNSDLNIIAIKLIDNGVEADTDEVPSSGYTLNTTKSICKVSKDGVQTKDENITINYHDGKIAIDNVSKKKTKCYLYFDKEPDTTKPVITNVTTSVTKTEINVTVTANDNGGTPSTGVTEYWYAIDSNTAVKGTTNTYKFTGLLPGSTHTIKVYVKDGAGNESDTTTKSVTTTAPTSEDTLAKLNITNYKTTTPDFSQASKSNEGIYRTSDGMYGGNSYYWRGAVTDNHVIFANKCWRIIRINGDGTIRMIYNGAVQSGNTCLGNGNNETTVQLGSTTVYNSLVDKSYYVGWTWNESQRNLSGMNSTVKEMVDNWYNNNIGNGTTHDKLVATGKYCNDRNVGNPLPSWSNFATTTTWGQDGNSFAYAALGRLHLENHKPVPTLVCQYGDTYNIKVGLITADEVSYAGGGWGIFNQSYYLFSGSSYWTMSPAYWNSGSGANVFSVNSDGRLINYSASDISGDSANGGVRPVINLSTSATFNSGSNGTSSKPYTVN